MELSDAPEKSPVTGDRSPKNQGEVCYPRILQILDYYSDHFCVKAIGDGSSRVVQVFECMKPSFLDVKVTAVLWRIRRNSATLAWRSADRYIITSPKSAIQSRANIPCSQIKFMPACHQQIFRQRWVQWGQVPLHDSEFTEWSAPPPPIPTQHRSQQQLQCLQLSAIS